MPIRPENKHRYPKDWKRIRAAILERADNRCEFCGVENHTYRVNPKTGKEAMIVLTIAHLDHTPENCDPDNLRALCQRCHNQYDALHRSITRKQTFAIKRMTPTVPIGHDYAHCEGQHNGHTCAMREGCTRYAMHLDAAALGLEYVCYLVLDSDISNGCPEFWPLRTSNNDYDKTHDLS